MRLLRPRSYTHFLRTNEPAVRLVAMIRRCITTRYTTMLLLAAVVAILLWGIAVPRALAAPQYRDPAILPPPPPSRDVPAQGFTSAPDSSGLPVLTPTIPPDYRALAEDELAADLATPSNIRTEVEYDIESGCYIVHTKVGEFDIATPFMLTPAVQSVAAQAVDAAVFQQAQQRAAQGGD